MKRFRSETAAYRLGKHGVGMQIACPKCSSTNTYWRTTSRSWQCRRCGQAFDAQFKPLRAGRRK